MPFFLLPGEDLNSPFRKCQLERGAEVTPCASVGGPRASVFPQGLSHYWSYHCQVPTSRIQTGSFFLCPLVRTSSLRGTKIENSKPCGLHWTVWMGGGRAFPVALIASWYGSPVAATLGLSIILFAPLQGTLQGQGPSLSSPLFLSTWHSASHRTGSK